MLSQTVVLAFGLQLDHLRNECFRVVHECASHYQTRLLILLGLLGFSVSHSSYIEKDD